MEYISGYYCRDEFDLDIVGKDSNRLILQALKDAYPNGLTVKQICEETNQPDKTVYPQIKSLTREHFIVEVGKDKKPRLRGRPSTSRVSSNQRSGNKFVIEEVTSIFDPFEGKKKGEIPLPPGNVEYSGQFLQLWQDTVEKDELESIILLLLRFLKKMVVKSIESKDVAIVNIAPNTSIENCCSLCGVNHEARDFLRALSLHVIDEMERSEPYLYFLKEYNFITEEAFKRSREKLTYAERPKPTDTVVKAAVDRIMREMSAEIEAIKRQYLEKEKKKYEDKDKNKDNDESEK